MISHTENTEAYISNGIVEFDGGTEKMAAWCKLSNSVYTSHLGDLLWNPCDWAAMLVLACFLTPFPTFILSLLCNSILCKVDQGVHFKIKELHRKVKNLENCWSCFAYSQNSWVVCSRIQSLSLNQKSWRHFLPKLVLGVCVSVCVCNSQLFRNTYKTFFICVHSLLFY